MGVSHMVVQRGGGGVLGERGIFRDCRIYLWKGGGYILGWRGRFWEDRL